MYKTSTSDVEEKPTSTGDDAGPSPVNSTAELEENDLKRGLEQRHIQMIALAGTIGTGLFLGSGRALANGGPLGTVLGYLLVGILYLGVMNSQAEMAALVPLSGGIVRHSEFFFDPALSFAVGWNYVYSHMVGVPAEIIASAVIVQFWTAHVNVAVWITIFGALLFVSNLFLVRVYGELEFTFALLKILLILALILFSIVISAGGGPNHQATGFRYWKNPGLFATSFLGRSDSLGKFLGFWTTLTNATFAYGGIEAICIPASETQAPRRNIPKATRLLFWRILFFYVLSILAVTLIVPSDDPSLLSSSGATVARSPFVIAGELQVPLPRLSVLMLLTKPQPPAQGSAFSPHVINAVVLTSAWSSGNSGMLQGSRVLYGLARARLAPKIFLRVNRWGTPHMTVVYFGVFMGLGYLSVSSSASVVFTWFQDLSAVVSMTKSIIICGVYLRFYYAMKRQGISRDELPWKAPFQPFFAWIGIIGFTIILIFGGYTTFLNGHWNTETFISSYFNIVLILVSYGGYKYIKKTGIVSLERMPIMKFIEFARANPDPPEIQKTRWRSVNMCYG